MSSHQLAGRAEQPSILRRPVALATAVILLVPGLFLVAARTQEVAAGTATKAARVGLVEAITFILLVAPVVGIALGHALHEKARWPWWPLIATSLALALLATVTEPATIAAATTEEAMHIWAGATKSLYGLFWVLVAAIQWIARPRPTEPS